MPDAAYYRAWRAAHPKYRDREKARRTQARRDMTPEQRDAHLLRRRELERAAYVPRERDIVVLPRFQGHDLYEQARAIVGPRTGTLTTLYDPRYDDHISEVVLALLEDRDPREALKLSKRFFVNYEYHTRDISIVMFRDNGGSATLET